jgi:hypothetical protein
VKVKFYQAFAFPVFTLFLALQLLFNSLNAQQRIPRFTEEEKNWSEYDLTGWQFGINLGMYLANKNSAAFLQWPARQRKQYSLHFKKLLLV